MKYIDDLSYLAAPTRRYLSWMTRVVIDNNLLLKQDTHLDYGCGKGSDVRILNERGYQSVGYDPYYYPDYPTEKADVVTCGYVLNVLTNPNERIEVLQRCWQLTNKRLIIAAKVGKEKKDTISLLELRATINIALERTATKLEKGIFLIEKSAPRIDVLTREEVITQCNRIYDEGWVAPRGATIKGYCTGFKGTKSRFSNHPSFGLFPSKRYFKLTHKHPVLPGKSGKLVKNVHLGKDKDCDSYRWAEEGILRRNKIMRLKFHCSDFSFLDEFNNCKNWNFLNPDWKPNPDPLGYTDQSRKPVYTRNPYPAIPLT